ncbi:YdaS family helix-turn-helix protein [Stenotrophomonas rhizophila]|uniref:YdaS family helix-turn-helix protein n=1 Tax=Stenotrophomonas rhizophila TaxID=216778 RepID=UPI00112F0314|nr:YdaS family helix-turn-helix protein [Stenotrophomonas rhizophila]
MDIPTYRKEKGLSQAAFAALLTASGTPATQGLVSQWEKGTTSIKAERAIQIDLATEGAVSRFELLPAVFGPMPVRTDRQALAASVDSRKSKRALRSKFGFKTDAHLAKVLKLPAAEVEGWPEEQSVPALPQVMRLLGVQETPPAAEAAPTDPDADRIINVEAA